MPNKTTKLSDIIDPEVMGDMIEAKIEARCKMIPYAKVDDTLEGVPGDTKTVPCWNYIGDATDYDPENGGGTEIETTNLTASSTTFTVKCAAKAVSILQTAINSGLGDPVGQAESQLATSILSKMDSDVVDAAYTSPTTTKAEEIISYNGIVEAVGKFEDEEDGIEKVLFIHPKQETQLLKDPSFLSADKFESGVAVRGSIGKIAGCWVKKSKKIKNDKTYYKDIIIKMEPDSEDTEYRESELPALTIFRKKGLSVDHEWFPKKQKHDITATEYYGAALTNAAKVVVAQFKMNPGP